MTLPPLPARRRSISAAAAFLLTLVASTGLGAVAAAPSSAATADVQQRPAAGVTADALPTVQIDGVVWKQAIVGNTVYAGGQFGYARPAGSPVGQNQTARNNLLAYDITTGNLLPSFAPSLNGAVKVLAVSPDKTRLYVGGAFTTADGVAHDRIAAYTVATGKLDNTFSANLNAQVNAITVTDTAVYVGGSFSTANGSARSRLAALNPATGALLGWAPTADGAVNAMLATTDGSKIITGGTFANVNGSPGYGLVALDPTTGSTSSWSANTIVRDYGSSAGQLSLSTDGATVYGSGYWYGGTGNFEGVWAADAGTGSIKWLADCHGDTYDAAPMNDAVVYSVSHNHNCANIGGFPETSPRTTHRANAFSVDAAGTVNHNSQSGYADFYGQGAPAAVNWFPDVSAGTFTGQNQGGWTLSANDRYLVMGGEFPKVNGTAQQGLVRFAVPSLAPNKQGPRAAATESAPTLNPMSSTSVRVSYKSNYDRDDQQLTYSVYREGTSTPLATTKATSQFWNRPVLSFTDTGRTPGTAYRYRIRASDASGNTSYSSYASVTTPSTSGATDAYATAVMADQPTSYWRLGETSEAASDRAGGYPLTLGSGTTYGSAGATGSADTAVTLDGTSAGIGATSEAVSAPTTFSVEAWVKTTSASGGKIIGFGDTRSGMSASYDRHVYLDSDGHLAFGVYDGRTHTLRSSDSYADGQWHYVVATLSSQGQTLYVDGRSVATDAGSTSASTYTGYWRVGGDNLNGWPNQPSSPYLQGTVDDVAVYATALTPDQVRSHYTQSGRTS